MIDLSKINGKAIVVNCELIESVEGGPDTVVTLTTGSKIIVQDRPAEIVRKVIEYRRMVNGQDGLLQLHSAEADQAETAAEEPRSGEQN